MTLILLLLLTTSQTCLSYEPDTVVLKGTIRRPTFAGPPNYESVAKGDQAETVWLLHLTHPICVSASSDWEKETGVSKLQLVFANRSQYDKALLNRKVDVTGTLYHAHTGHHHTTVLITVASIKIRVARTHR
jgi:hypothetical protein